ncbi:MAG: right-handed parallel beta-helix repeat-containing protein [Candidatus Hodarchaeota archaeon]
MRNSTKDIIKRIMPVLVILLVIIPIMLHLSRPARLDPRVPELDEVLLQHSYIEINGESELESFPNKTGSGTESDPYVIQDLNITWGPMDLGIYIIYIESYLVIENCTLENCGIDAWGDNLVVVQNCTVKNHDGAGIANHRQARIFNNTVINCNVGIHSSYAYAIIDSNNISYCDIGIQVSAAGIVTGNDIRHCTSAGISLYRSCQVVVDNNLVNCSIGRYDGTVNWFISCDRIYGNVVDGQEGWIFIEIIFQNKSLLILILATFVSLAFILPVYKALKINKHSLVRSCSAAYILLFIVFFSGFLYGVNQVNFMEFGETFILPAMLLDFTGYMIGIVGTILILLIDKKIKNRKDSFSRGNNSMKEIDGSSRSGKTTVGVKQMLEKVKDDIQSLHDKG